MGCCRQPRRRSRKKRSNAGGASRRSDCGSGCLFPLGGLRAGGGLELAGPYMFLLAGGVCVIVALGLWWLHRWARWLAILIAIISVIMLLPSVSSALLDFRIARLAWGGLGTILRVLIVWYLLQEPVHNSFNAN